MNSNINWINSPGLFGISPTGVTVKVAAFAFVDTKVFFEVSQKSFFTNSLIYLFISIVMNVKNY